MEQESKKRGLWERIKDRYRNKSFVFWDYVILAAALILFMLLWVGITRASNTFFAGSFFTEGYRSTYHLEGVTEEKLGSEELTIETVESGEDRATVEVTVGGETRSLVIDKENARVLDDTQTGVPLIYYYEIVREPHQVSATFGEETEPVFSSEFTGLEGEIHAEVKDKNADNLVMWYHESEDRSYGPQFSWELHLYDDVGERVGTIINDVTSGVLLDARFYQDGWGSMNLTETNYPTGLNRWAIFYGFNSILVLWGIFHLLRARSRREEWEAHWEYFPLDFLGISRFFIRLLALTTFGFLGMGVLTGDPTKLLISDLIGFGLMIYAVGVFAFPILFKFIPWIAAAGVFAWGRSMDYVQYPFGVLLYLTAVLMYVIYKYKCYKEVRKLGFVPRLGGFEPAEPGGGVEPEGGEDSDT